MANVSLLMFVLIICFQDLSKRIYWSSPHIMKTCLHHIHRQTGHSLSMLETVSLGSQCWPCHFVLRQ